MSANSSTFKADITRRLRCTEGHLRGITAMMERGEDCPNLIHQLLAAQGALREVNRLLLKHHLEVCLRERLQQSNDAFRERSMDEIVTLYQQIGLSAR